MTTSAMVDAAGAGPSTAPAGAAAVAGVDELAARIGDRFARPEVRLQARAYIAGLLSPLERKNGVTVAEQTGGSTDGIQRLLRTARWDADGVRDDVHRWVLGRLGEASTGVVAVREAVFAKKGRASAGVHRRPSTRQERSENGQLGVFAVYASSWGHALTDRELYLPPEWTEDRDRCRRADVPESVGYATRPQLARRMLQRVLDAGTPASWVQAEASYGQNVALRSWLESPPVAARLGYVLATEPDDRLTGPGGGRRAARTLLSQIASEDWASVGFGRRGYVWARVERSPEGLVAGHGRWMLVRRRVKSTRGGPDREPEYAFYRASGPADTSLEQLARVAATQWCIDICLRRARSRGGLHDYQVRTYPGWYRHMTLALAADAITSTAPAGRGDHCLLPTCPFSG